jgi:hypothetical protein
MLKIIWSMRKAALRRSIGHGCGKAMDLREECCSIGRRDDELAFASSAR